MEELKKIKRDFMIEMLQSNCIVIGCVRFKLKFFKTKTNFKQTFKLAFLLIFHIKDQDFFLTKKFKRVLFQKNYKNFLTMHSLVQCVEKRYRHVRQSNRLRTVVKDRYLRNDIGCGSMYCLDCTYEESNRATLSDDKTITNIHTIPDTNVLLYQLDVLFHDEFLQKRDKLKGIQYTMNMIILESVMEQKERWKHNNVFKDLYASCYDDLLFLQLKLSNYLCDKYLA
ncbi:hypothetical protein RFI_25319 [Reticulomyxa filosa]|uniref:Uncharacterized protein n=1 Tax=Reticulomyxa filosa TaxID=46433 RepID=X6MF66_RETFI|nr:hypothetical protein RFI_25319 [Reticulomyxa filosa]|eukprot:ETO12057.1 hypothetical protein RFI_25319 [Reticulomyxa filosa]